MSEDYVDKWTIGLTMLTFYAVLGYFGFLMRYNLLKSPMDFVVRVGLPGTVLPVVVFYLHSEIAGRRKFQRSREVFIKRLAGRILLGLGFLSIFFIFLVGAITAGLWAMGVNFFVPMVIMVGSSALIVLIITVFKEPIRRISDGLW